MFAGESSNVPNPFATAAVGSRLGMRPLASALKILLVVLIAFAVIVLVGSESRRWLFGRLTEGFESLEAEQKRDRLAQIAELDELAIPFLVTTMNDPDIAVARTAHDLLRRLQDEWTTLRRSQMLERQRTMILALEAQALQLPDDRTGWASGLAQRMMMETVDRKDESSQELHRLAADTLSRLSLSARPGPSVLDSTPGDSPRPVRVASRMEPLPVEMLEDGAHRSTATAAGATPGQWVDGADGRDSARNGDAAGDRRSDGGSTDADRADADESDRAPSIYQPSATTTPAVRMRPIEQSETVELREIDDVWDAGQREGAAQAASHLVNSPLEMLDDRSVIHWLGSDDPARREQAREELTRRGLDEHEIEIAAGVASTDLQTRLEVIDAITRSSRLDPRPWLLMLLEDSNRDVKLRVISALATMSDPGIESRLRIRMAEEPDPTVAARIRSVLQLR